MYSGWGSVNGHRQSGQSLTGRQGRGPRGLLEVDSLHQRCQRSKVRALASTKRSPFLAPRGAVVARKPIAPALAPLACPRNDPRRPLLWGGPQLCGLRPAARATEALRSACVLWRVRVRTTACARVCTRVRAGAGACMRVCLLSGELILVTEQVRLRDIRKGSRGVGSGARGERQGERCKEEFRVSVGCD